MDKALTDIDLAISPGPEIAQGDGRPLAPPALAPPAPAFDYVRPADLLADVVTAASVKVGLSIKDMLIRGFLAGAFLGFATALAFTVTGQGLPPIVGAAIFPAGFVMLALLGLELATGNFAILPAGMAAGRIRAGGLLRNWTWVYLGNLVGCLFFALLFYAVTTKLGTTAEIGPAGEAMRTAAESKTLGYKALGGAGWTLSFVKALLANWMVTVGAVMFFVSKSTFGKAAVMWLPIMTFFALGFEHSIVNMFVVPVGMLFGAKVSMADWWLWNQIPVTLGNIVAGALFTGLALYYTYRPKPAKAAV
jgi:formate transporter